MHKVAFVNFLVLRYITLMNHNDLITSLGLQSLEPEGGYFRFVDTFGQNSGCIYYLITDESFSHLHSLTQDEIWFFLEGDSAVQTTVSPDGTVSQTVLDADNRISIVRKDHFQATRIKRKEKGYSLFSTVMSPHYEDSMFRDAKDRSDFENNEILRELI